MQKNIFGNWFKTNAQANYERQEYFRWAYPFGDIQKNKLEDILYELIQDEDKTSYIFNYLVTKQECDKAIFDSKIENKDLINIAKEVNKQMFDNKGKNTHKYIALAEYDLKIKKGLKYPSIKTLEKRSLEIKSIIG